MSQSSIDYLVKIVQSCIPPNYIPKEIIKQAKEMHKQEIENAHEIGYINGGNAKNINGLQYYNETFKP